MLALVTGAAGFIGSSVVDALLARGDDVRGIDSFSPYYDRSVKEQNLASARDHTGFALHEIDLREADLPGMLDGVDTVFHLAAQPGVRLSWADRFGDYESNNIVATQRLLEACRRSPVRRLVYSSSSSVYGNPVEVPTVESTLPRPHSPYGVTKLAAEHLCALYADNWALPVVSLRYFTVYGPRQRPDMAIHRLVRACLGGGSFPVYGDGRQQRDFTFVGDVVRANMVAAAADVTDGTAVNIAGGGSISLRDLIELVAELTGAAPVVERHPVQPGDVGRTGGDVSLARRLLGWEPEVALRDGISAEIAWLAAGG